MSASRQIVRTYGRDSLLVWANLVLAPLLAALGMRVGLQSERRLAAKMASDSASLRRRGYLVTSVETFSLPGIGRPDAGAHWYRVTYEQTQPANTGTKDIR
jgi:hypothetical protein